MDLRFAIYAVIVALLLIGGIELNPGPVYTCQRCESQFNSVSDYYDHHKVIHSVADNVPCLHCDYCAPTKSALQTHLTRCSLKGRKAFSSEEGQNFVCPFDDCAAHHTSKSDFLAHLRTCHEAPSSQPGGHPAPASTPSLPQNKFVHPKSVSVPCSSASSDSQSKAPDPYPPSVVKDAVLEFYVRLEGEHVLPASTVQIISEYIAKFTEMSHHCLKKSLENELRSVGIVKSSIASVVNKTFLKDPVYNMHHEQHTAEQVTSIYLRKKLLMNRLPYVSPVEVFLGRDEMGKPKLAHRVPVKETLETLLKDPKVKEEILKSFTLKPSEDGILRDFRDGSIFREHLKIHKKCIQLILFQDAFEHSPFGPAKGKYKTIGMYYVLGNFSPELRSKVDKILLSMLLLEDYLKTNEAEHLNECDKFAKALKSLIDELKNLELNGITIDGENIPVCVLFVAGDNLGSHQIGSFVQSFTADNCCRFCPISTKAFKKEPWKCLELRTPEEYNQCVLLAKEKWTDLKTKSLEQHNRRKELQAQRDETVSKTMVSKNALKKLRSIHHLGVKPIPSALNSLPNFHVTTGLPSCIAHDLYQGIIDTVLIKILRHFIVEKEWFDLETLNRRITHFQCKCSDADDAPTPIHSFDGIKGHACETWTFTRLLTFMIGDLIKEKDNAFWKLYLQLKEICEYVCAPQIRERQVAQLDHLIQLYLCTVQELLPECITPKHHFLRHYPTLILQFGPLIRLFTMRFESKHVFFKKVARMCHNFINITHTQAEKYMYRFAQDQINGIIPPDVICHDAGKSLHKDDLQEDMFCALPQSLNFSQVSTPNEVFYKGTQYKVDMFMILERFDVVDLSVGRIEKILLHDKTITLCLREYVALNSFQGYYYLHQERRPVVRSIESLPDHYPLPVYLHNGRQCLSLKHTLHLCNLFIYCFRYVIVEYIWSRVNF